jgi:dipeptidyl aminopeptidase/acylaminoacyl peptidase
MSKTVHFIIVFLLGGLLMSATSHPFNVHDMLAMDRISDLRLSPDGTALAFVLRKTDLEANRGRTDVWMLNTLSGQLKQMTQDPAGDFSPRWSSCGKSLLFLSTRSGSSQVWQMAADGTGEPVQLTDLPLDVNGFVVSPRGDALALIMDVFVDAKTPEETKARLEDEAKRKASGRIYDRLFFRHWDTWNDGRRSHVHLFKTQEKTIVDLMAGMDSDSPTKPFGGDEEICFTPDGMGIVFTAKPISGSEEAWSTNYDLFYVPTNASAAPKALTTNPAWDTTPVFSPDGKTLAYLAMSRPGYEADRFRLILRDWQSGKERVLTENWDRSVSSIAWDQSARTIYVTADHLGQKPIFAISVKDGKVSELVSQGTVSSVQVGTKTIFYGLDTLRSPVEIHGVSKNGKTNRQLTRINEAQLAVARMGDYEQFTFKGANDETVYAYLVKPVDFDPAKKYPLAFLIHGGPQGSFGNHFHYRWNPQTYTGAGFAAVMVDFHGSTGYGQAFTDAINGDWGGKPLEDLKKGKEAALARYPWIDGTKSAALGASYGGYMINWIAGNWPDGFSCLVNHDGNLDERLAYYDTEELWFPEWEHKGTPWENPEGYEKHNPINFVRNWKTPMLVVHGALDYRVVETQGMSTFTALQRKGIPSRFLYFPDENHWVLKPHNSILWHDTVLDWIKSWTK